MGTEKTINGMKVDFDPNKVITVVANHGGTGESHEFSYTHANLIGNGSFGVVFAARVVGTNEMIAIKKVLQDRRFKNRELQIMRLVSHPNIVTLKEFFYANEEKTEDVYLNLVLEFIPETIYRASRHYAKQKQNMPLLHIKLYTYQLFRSLAYIHSLGICHRDIKPQNLLLDPASGILKLCDFGSAKILVAGEPNVSYICSRYYRAPELIFGATNYTTSIDIWSSGCVMAELMLGRPLFPGESGVDQLVEIIKVLGTPTREHIQAMNQNYTEFKFPQIKANPWSKVFQNKSQSAEALAFIDNVLQYTPTERNSPIEALVHPFFDELRDPATQLNAERSLPPLFNFTTQELELCPHLNDKLVPPHARPTLLAAGIDLEAFATAAAISAAKEREAEGGETSVIDGAENGKIRFKRHHPDVMVTLDARAVAKTDASGAGKVDVSGDNTEGVETVPGAATATSTTAAV